MENTFREKAMEINIEAWRKVGFPIPEAYKNWCMEHGREDLLGDAPSAESGFSPLPSRGELAAMFGIDLPADLAHESLEEPASEEDIDAMLNLALETMARDLGIKIPANLTKESSDIDPNGELPSMKEIFGIKE